MAEDLPWPPAALPALRDSDVVSIPEDTEFWRVHAAGGKHATQWHEFRRFGPIDARFDHHLPPASTQARAILYATTDGPTAFAEVFQRERVIDRETNSPWLAAFRLSRAVPVLDLCNNWPVHAKANQAIHAGSHERARAWSRLIYETYGEVIGGVHYRSSITGRDCVALYESSESAVRGAPTFHRALADPTLNSYVFTVGAELGYDVL